MDLKTYIDSRRFEMQEFADMVGITPASLYNYIARRRRPTLEIGRKIQEITKGKVTIDDLLTYWENKNGE